MSWATAEDVQVVTGKTVDDEIVQQAGFIVELTSGGRMAALDDTKPSARNLYWLRNAVAYQAAFMVDHPDYFSRMDVDTYTQDGVSASIRSDGLVLAPLARRCLKRLSWRGMRTVQSTTRATVNRGGIYTSDDYDDSLPWRRT